MDDLRMLAKKARASGDEATIKRIEDEMFRLEGEQW